MAPDLSDLSRRDALKIAAATAAAVATGCTDAAPPPAAATPGPPVGSAQTFFTPDELAMADELSEIIIPTDANSLGARAAKVAAYIDRRLAEAWDEAERTLWRQGLKSVDDLSRSLHRKAFMQASLDERIAVVTRMAANEDTPEKPEEKFFADLKSRVVDAYYSSEIGIKQELKYLGNTYQDEYAGTDVSRS
jgi:hypothetical protein